MNSKTTFLALSVGQPWMTWSTSFVAVVLAFSAGPGRPTDAFGGEPASETGTPPSPPPSRLAVGFSGELPDFVVQVPDTKSEVSGEVVARLGLSWVRDWLAETPYETDAPLVRAPILPQWKTVSDIWFVGRLGFTPVGTAAGLVYGGLAGESAKKIDRAVPSITNALAELQIPNRFEPLLLALLQEKWRGMTALKNRLPHESTFHRPGLMDQLVPLPAEWQGLRETRVNVSAFEGADAAVVLRVISWGLMGRRARNPPLSLHFSVKGTVVNLRDRTKGKEIYAGYESREQKFVAWSAEGARELRDELRRAVQSVADQMAAQVPAPPPVSSPTLFVATPDI
jgi:hypothetical protein